MPAKIHIFRDDDASSVIPSSRAPSSRASSVAPSMTSGTSSRRPSTSRRISQSNGGVAQVQLVGKSLISTKVSTVTMALDKENRDPVTGVLLPELLNSLGCSGGAKTSKQVGNGICGTSLDSTTITKQKFIATTITTTVLSPMMDSTPCSSSRATPEPHDSSRNANTDAMQEDNDAPSTPRPPQRKSRVVISSVDSPASRTRAKTGSSSSDLVVRAGRIPLGQKTAFSTRGTKSSPLKTKPSTFVDTDGTPKRTRTSRSMKKTTNVDSSDPLHPIKKSSKSRSGTSSSSSSKRVKKAVMAQHSSFVQSVVPSSSVFDHSAPPPDHLAMDYILQGPPLEDGDMGINDVSEVPAIVQRMVDQRCRELTVMPLANVSEAYGALSSAFGSDTDGMY